MIPVILNVLAFVRVCVAFIYSPLIVIMCDIFVKQTYQNGSHIHIVKNITSDHLSWYLLLLSVTMTCC